MRQLCVRSRPILRSKYLGTRARALDAIVTQTSRLKALKTLTIFPSSWHRSDMFSELNILGVPFPSVPFSDNLLSLGILEDPLSTGFPFMYTVVFMASLVTSIPVVENVEFAAKYEPLVDLPTASEAPVLRMLNSLRFSSRSRPNFGHLYEIHRKCC